MIQSDLLVDSQVYLPCSGTHHSYYKTKQLHLRIVYLYKMGMRYAISKGCEDMVETFICRKLGVFTMIFQFSSILAYLIVQSIIGRPLYVRMNFLC